MFLGIQWEEIADRPVRRWCIQMRVEPDSLDVDAASSTDPAPFPLGLSSAEFSSISDGRHMASLEAPLTEDRIGIVVYDRESRPDAVLRQVIQGLKSVDLRVGGLLQEGRSGDAGRCGTLFLEDIGTGRRIQAFETRGSGTRGCRLDSSSLAEAGGWLRAAIEGKPDILFVNRFGRQEAAGRGLRDEIAAAIAAGLPVVIAVSQELVPEWRAFAGPDFVRLTVDPKRIEAWCLACTKPALPASEDVPA